MTVTLEQLLLIGHVVAAFGTRGQVKLRLISDQPLHIAEHVQTLYVGNQYTPYTLKDIFEHKPGLLILTLEDVATRDAAEDLRRSEVYIHESDAAPLAEDEYYIHDLYHLRVETVEGELLGQVTDVIETGSNDVLVVRGEQEILIPMTYEVIEELNLADKCIVVRLLEGMR